MPHGGAPKARGLTASARAERSSMFPRCASSSDAVRKIKYQILQINGNGGVLATGKIDGLPAWNRRGLPETRVQSVVVAGRFRCKDQCQLSAPWRADQGPQAIRGASHGSCACYLYLA